MAQTCECSEGKSVELLFPCSGGSDVGEIADRVARKLSRSGKGTMYCLAGIGGRVSGIFKTTQAATDFIAINGCPLDCASHTLWEAGFLRFDSVRVTDFGFKKGESPVTEDSIEKVAEEVARKFSFDTEGNR